jgi:hypothetical protein
MMTMRLLLVCCLLSTSLMANPFWKKTTQPAGTERAKAARKKYKAPKVKKAKKLKKAKVQKAPVTKKSIG